MLNKKALHFIPMLFLLIPLTAIGATFSPSLKIFTPDLILINEYPFPVLSSFDLARLDLGGDGIDEIAVASGSFNQPRVYLLRVDGSEINHFLAYAENFEGGVNITACDLDGDNKDEIITGAGYSGGSHIRIFDGYGQSKFTPGFFAGNPLARNGIKVACGDVNGDHQKEIIAGVLTNYGLKIIFFDKDGNEVLNRFTVTGYKNDFDLETVDLGGDGISEIIVAGGLGEKPKLKIFRADGSLINEFLTYAENFLGGANISSGDINNDNLNEIIVGAGVTGGPHLRIFNGYGQLLNESFVFTADFRGGVQSVVGNFNQSKPGPEILSVPSYIPVGRQDLKKYIEIDLSADKLSYYEQGLLMGRYLVSLGKRGSDTPKGDFLILNQALKVWSPYGLWMPYWLGLGRFGIHELPIWPSGYREGADHLGQKVSHGCIRLGIGPAEKLYRWAEIGTPVTIHD